MLTRRRLANRLVRWASAVIERAGAIRPGTDPADRFGSFGAGSLIDYPQATIYGERSIHLGENTLIGRHCSLLVGYDAHVEHLPERGLVLGDRCVVGEGSMFAAHGSIVIEDDVWFGRNVFVCDASHGYQDVERPIGLQLGTTRPVRIGAGSWVGQGAIILPGTTIGRHVVVAAGSVVRGSIPDHCIVAGVPAEVVRRLEPDRGWVSTSDPDDVRPAWTPQEYAALLTGGAPYAPGSGLTGAATPMD